MFVSFNKIDNSLHKVIHLKSMSLHPDIIRNICRLLRGNVILCFLRISKDFYKVYDKINKYIVAFTNRDKPIMIMSSKHKKFKYIHKLANLAQNKKKYSDHKFYKIISTDLGKNDIWIINFQYRIVKRSKSTDPHRWTAGEYKKYLKKRTICTDNIHFISSYINVCIKWIKKQIKSKIINIMKQNKIECYNTKTDYEDNPKTYDELLDESISNILMHEGYHWDADDSYFKVSLCKIELPKKSKIKIHLEGTYNELISKPIDKTTFKKLVKSKTSQLYLTHDNGGRTFLVICNKSNVCALVFNGKNEDYNPYDIKLKKLYEYNIPVMEYTDIIQCFPGKDVDEKYLGNSVLIHIKNNRYAFIGDCIYEFDTFENDKIIEYYSMVGNSDVPYPVALGEKYVYMMLDHSYIARSDFPENYNDWMDAYGCYYGHSRPDGKKMEDIPMLNYKKIYERKF